MLEACQLSIMTQSIWYFTIMSGNIQVLYSFLLPCTSTIKNTAKASFSSCYSEISCLWITDPIFCLVPVLSRLLLDDRNTYWHIGLNEPCLDATGLPHSALLVFLSADLSMEVSHIKLRIMAWCTIIYLNQLIIK